MKSKERTGDFHFTGASGRNSLVPRSSRFRKSHEPKRWSRSGRISTVGENRVNYAVTRALFDFLVGWMMSFIYPTTWVEFVSSHFFRSIIENCVNSRRVFSSEFLVNRPNGLPIFVLFFLFFFFYGANLGERDDSHE
jgi:hypothetical protein